MRGMTGLTAWIAGVAVAMSMAQIPAAATASASIGPRRPAAGPGHGLPGYSSVVIAQRPLGYWRLGESSTAAKAADSSGNGRAGHYSRCVRLKAKGALADSANTAALFPRVRCYVSFKPNAQYVGDFTAEAWVRPSGSIAKVARTFLDSRAPAGPDGQGEYGFDLKLTGTAFAAGQTIRVDIGNGSNWLYSGGVPFRWTAGTWYFIAATVGPGHMVLYVNGAQFARLPLSVGIPLIMDRDHPLTIGDNPRYDSGGVGESFDGAIDEVALFGRALSGRQVRAQYAAGVGKHLTTIHLSISPGSANARQPVTYSARITGAGRSPSGRVSFRAASRLLCVAKVVRGAAHCRSAAAPAGGDRITARYSGDRTALWAVATGRLTVYRPLDSQLERWLNGDPAVVGPGSDPQQMPETAVFSLGPNAPALFPGSVIQAAPANVATGTLISNPLPAGSGTVTMNGLLLQNKGIVYRKVSSATLPNVSQAIQEMAAQPAYPDQTGVDALDYTQESSSQTAEFSADASFSYLGSGGSGFFKDADNTSETHIFLHLRQTYYTVSYTPSRGDLAGFFAKDVTTRRALACHCMSAANPPAYISSVAYGSELYIMADGSATASDMTAALKAAVSYGAANGSVSVSTEQKATLDQMQVHVLALGGSAPADSALFSDVAGQDGANILNGFKEFIQAQFAPQNNAITAAVPVAYSLAYVDLHPIGMYPTPTAGPPPLPPGTTGSIDVCVTVGNNDKEYQTPVYVSLTASNGVLLLPQTGDLSNATYWNDGYTNCSNPWQLTLSQPIPTYELSGAMFLVDAPGDSWHGQFTVWANDSKSGRIAVLLTNPNMYYNDTSSGNPCGNSGQSTAQYLFNLVEPGTTAAPTCGNA